MSPPGVVLAIARRGHALAATVGLVCLVFGFQAIAQGGARNGIPAFPFLLFGVVGTLGAVNDLRMLRASLAVKGAPRVTRHLWRMSLAFFIAAMSFFFGQAGALPRPLRVMPFLAVPVLAVLVTLLWWLWRVRIRNLVRRRLGLALEHLWTRRCSVANQQVRGEILPAPPLRTPPNPIFG